MKKATESSMFTDVEYTPETQELTVTWRKDGKTTTYYDVPSQVGLDFFNSDSHGRAYNLDIKNKFESDISRAATAAVQAESAPPIEQDIPESPAPEFGDIEDDEDEDF